MFALRCEQMSEPLTHEDVQRLVRETVSGMPHEQCRTCDCFQGFLAQLEIDAIESVSGVTGPLRVEREEMHGCLGCDPCPAGAAFAEYLKAQQQERNIEPKAGQVSSDGEPSDGPPT